jgi:hypothetical protein
MQRTQCETIDHKVVALYESPDAFMKRQMGDHPWDQFLLVRNFVHPSRLGWSLENLGRLGNLMELREVQGKERYV